MLACQHHEPRTHETAHRRAPPMSDVPARLERLRDQMRRHGVDAWWAPTGDPHLSEYVAAPWRTRDWLSGFRGSAGTLVVTHEHAALWVDPRYHMRADTETAGTPITVFKVGIAGTPDVADWLARTLPPGATLGLDPATASVAAVSELEARLPPPRLALRPLPHLIDAVWSDRPAIQAAPITPHPIEYAGESAASKLDRLRAAARSAGATHVLVTALDEVAWLLNLRGADVPMSPVALAYGLVHEASVDLIVHEDRVSDALRRALPTEVRVLPYDGVEGRLRSLPAEATVWIDPDRTNLLLHRALHGTRTHLGPSPVQRMKALKNAVELRGAATAYRKDGLALTRLLHWLATTEPERHTEVSVAAKLEAFRSALPDYRGPSFGTIVGFGPNAAVGHYAADPDAPQRLGRDGVLLVDCGAQFPEGTTDTTRTIALGPPTVEQVRAYTTVLKGLIALSVTTFPEGTTGRQLDAIARAPLWARGWECRHGIGHGIGSYLYVHEGPQRFAKTNDVALEAGMTTTCEPGVYFEGAFGVRLENVLATVPTPATDFGRFLGFETLTLCPFDRDLIDATLLTDAERAWVDAYHLRVRDALSPDLDATAAAWLAERTRPLPR